MDASTSISDVYVPRYKQLDASIWDSEFDRQLRLLINKIGLTNVAAERDIELLAKLYIFKQLIGDNTSIGQRCLGLRYYNVIDDTHVSAALSLYQKLGLATLNIILPWISSRPRSSFSRSTPSTRSRASLLSIDNLSMAIKISRLLCFYAFLRQGKYRSLEERMLGIVCGPEKLGEGQTRVPDLAQYEIMSRELLWETLAEFLTFVIPLTNFHKLKNTCLRAIGLQPPLNSSTGQQHQDSSNAFVALDTGARSIRDLTKCAICDKAPVCPHEIGCRHVFCYYCVYAHHMADPSSGVMCPKCENTRVTSQSIRRLSVLL